MHALGVLFGHAERVASAEPPGCPRAGYVCHVVQPRVLASDEVIAKTEDRELLLEFNHREGHEESPDPYPTHGPVPKLQRPLVGGARAVSIAQEEDERDTAGNRQ